jgi:glyoxylase-like metal-dependent hydrolase (beta-lactamase superfamily II)
MPDEDRDANLTGTSASTSTHTTKSRTGRPSIRRIPIRTPSTRAPGGTTNAYVLGDLLVDPAGRHPDLDRVAESVEHVAVTHAHPDHVGAVAEYAAAAEATTWAPSAFADRFEEATGAEPDATFTEGDAIGSADATAIATPGHAVDHVAFAVGEGTEHEGDPRGGEAILCGDLALAEGSVVVSREGGGLRAYLESLRRIRDRDPTVLYPGHGPAIQDPRSTLDRLIDRRLDRERSVLEAVEAGASDVDAVLEGAYDRDLTGVEDLARATVRAHLEKLLEEGRIGEAWRERL